MTHSLVKLKGLSQGSITLKLSWSHRDQWSPPHPAYRNVLTLHSDQWDESRRDVCNVFIMSLKGRIFFFPSFFYCIAWNTDVVASCAGEGTGMTR